MRRFFLGLTLLCLAASLLPSSACRRKDGVAGPADKTDGRTETASPASPLTAPPLPAQSPLAPQTAEGMPALPRPTTNPPPLAKGAEFTLTEPVIRLVSAGAGRRVELAYRFDRRPYAFTVEADARFALTLGPLPFPDTALPRLQGTVTVSPRGLTPAGELRADLVLETVRLIDVPGVSPLTRSMVEQAIRRLPPEGVKGSLTLDRKGVVKSCQLDLPSGLTGGSAFVRSGAGWRSIGLVPPLPAQPVGAGAKWEWSQEFRFGGARFRQVGRFTLVGAPGPRYTIRAVVLFTLLEPGGGAVWGSGISGALESFSADASGDLTVDPVRPTATFRLGGKVAGRFQVVSSGARQTGVIEAPFSVAVQ